MVVGGVAKRGEWKKRRRCWLPTWRGEEHGDSEGCKVESVERQEALRISEKGEAAREEMRDERRGGGLGAWGLRGVGLSAGL